MFFKLAAPYLRNLISTWERGPPKLNTADMPASWLMTQLNPAGRRMPCTCPKHCCRCPRRAVFLYGSACRFVPLVRSGRAAPCLVVGGYSSQTAQPTQEEEGEEEEPQQQRRGRLARKRTVHISFCCWTLASGHQAMLWYSIICWSRVVFRGSSLWSSLRHYYLWWIVGSSHPDPMPSPEPDMTCSIAAVGVLYWILPANCRCRHCNRKANGL